MSDEYDPDMDVREALHKGLIVAHDVALMGDTYLGGCLAPIPPYGYSCTRNIGHEGVHSVLLRLSQDTDTALLLRSLEGRARNYANNTLDPDAAEELLRISEDLRRRAEALEKRDTRASKMLSQLQEATQEMQERARQLKDAKAPPPLPPIVNRHSRRRIVFDEPKVSKRGAINPKGQRR